VTLDQLPAEALPEVVSGHRLVSVLEDLSGEVRFAGTGPQGHPIELRAFRGPRASDPTVGEALERTLSQAALLRHRAVVGVTAWGRVEGALWVAGEPTDGVTLDEVAAQVGVIPARAAVEIALEVAGALDHAFAVSHQVPGPPLHHGALTEDRVEITASGRVRVRDLGLSPLHEPFRGSAPAWVPPEVRTGGVFDVRGDLFSLGVLLGSLATGGPVLVGGDAPAALRALEGVHGSRALETRLDQRGRGLGEVVLRLIAADPAARFETPADAEAALLSLRGALLPDRRLDELVHEVVGAVGGRRPAARVRAPVIRMPEDTLASGLVPAREPTVPLDITTAPGREDEAELTTAGGSPPPFEPTTAPGGAPPVIAETLGSAPTVEEAGPVAAPRSPPVPEASPPKYSMRDFVAPRPPSSPASAAEERPLPPPAFVPPPAPPPPALPRPAPPSPTPLPPAPRAPAPAATAVEGAMPRPKIMLFAGLLVLGAVLLVLLVPRGEDSDATAPEPEAPPAPEEDAFTSLDAAPPAPADAAPAPDEATPEAVAAAVLPPEPSVAPPTPPAPRPAPVVAPPEDAGPVTLSLKHRPVAAGSAGASELVSVRVDGPPDTEVVLHFGPPGGPHEQRALGAKSGGRWEGWLPLPAAGVGLEYWIVARHPRASSVAGSGSSGAPHTVQVR